MKLRAFVPADTGDLISLWRACNLLRPWNDAETDIDLATGSPCSAIIVLEVDARIRGSVMVGFDGHRGWVYYLAVAPQFQRQGCGRMLMNAAEDWLRCRGAPKIQFMVRDGNEDAVRFYERLGFERQPVSTFGRRLDRLSGS